MLELFDEISKRCRAGERVALCTVVDARGSTPQARGARMLVTAAGQLMGTLGGGCVEAEVKLCAMRRLHARQPADDHFTGPPGDEVNGDAVIGEKAAGDSMSFRLDHDHGWDDGMWCGGILDVHVQILAGKSAAEEFATVAANLRAGKPARLEIAAANFVEVVEPAPPLLIAGGGHVAQALASLAAELGFEVTVIDDRADVVSAARFPNAARVAGDVDLELTRRAIDERTYIVIVTRGHHRDAAALAAVIDSSAKYIGMIGSKRKVRTILGHLAEQGVAREKLAAVRSPIGLEIGAISVPEIALSIAAELTAVRRGEQDCAGAAMKILPQELNNWLDRDCLG